MCATTRLFTTHTPVPAGNDEFPLWVDGEVLRRYWPQLGLDRQAFLDLGAQGHRLGRDLLHAGPRAAARPAGPTRSRELHGQVARRMWPFLWPDPRDQVPITHITNGVHTATWLARRWAPLRPPPAAGLARAHRRSGGLGRHRRIPDAELWECGSHLKRKLVAYIRERARLHWLADHVHPVQAGRQRRRCSIPMP